MIGVLIIPTGLQAEIGGHAGDANPVAKLFGECCDTLITHPNVVNASDINEMTDNTLYVEGSMLDMFLQGAVRLKPVTRNNILVAINSRDDLRTINDSINAVEASRVTLGCNIDIIKLDTPLVMTADIKDGLVDGTVVGWEQLCDQVRPYLSSRYDALAIHTKIDVSREIALNYYENGGVNPWGRVEAIASKLIARTLRMPVAHAPKEAMSIEDQKHVFQRTCDPRIAPEVISGCFLHSVLKGLSRAPELVTDGTGISVKDVDFMVVPAKCWGDAHTACVDKNIRIIRVAENHVIGEFLSNHPYSKEFLIDVQNYWEAAGYVMALKAGIDPSFVRRPLQPTKILD